MRGIDRDPIRGGHYASGHVNRTDRPNTWLLRPLLHTSKAFANQEQLIGLEDMPLVPAKHLGVGASFTGERAMALRPGRAAAVPRPPSWPGRRRRGRPRRR